MNLSFSHFINWAKTWLVFQRAGSGSKDEAEKALYAILALLSSNHEGQRQFYHGGGVKVLKALLSAEPGTRQLRKVLDIITDLTDALGKVEVGCDNLLKASCLHMIAHLPNES